MTAVQQLEHKDRQEGEHNKALHIAKNMLSTLHLDMQAVAQQLGEKYEQKGMQQERLHLAKSMLSMLHLDVETVAQATGLSQEKLMKLQTEMNQ